jgi:predicted TPR repeat methyltransferase
MLAVARTRTIYDQLVHEELSGYLESHPGTFDVIVSADTLVYFGELAEVFASAARALSPAGLLVFTVEAMDDVAVDTGYHLNPHGRYSHSQVYVKQVLRDAGFATPFIETAVLRMESGSPVTGLVVAVRKANHNPEP